jgi:hypothetical protein
MGLWYRVFGRGAAEPAPQAILDHLDGLGVRVAGRFEADDAGWFRAEFDFGGAAPLQLDRFLATEKGIRAELNSWAAFLETCADNPNHLSLMERMIQTAQLFTLERPGGDEAQVERLCVGLCTFLARQTDGVWQADGRGFFAADGSLLARGD